MNPNFMIVSLQDDNRLLWLYNGKLRSDLLFIKNNYSKSTQAGTGILKYVVFNWIKCKQMQQGVTHSKQITI